MKSQLKRLIIVSTFISGFLFLPGCKKEEITSDVPVVVISPNLPASFDDFEFSGIFNGNLYSGNTSSSIEGYVTIDATGITTLDLLSGIMKGMSVKVADQYNITINQVTGIFQDVTNITGSIDASSRTLYLSGTNADGTQLTISGATPEVLRTGGWENLSKSAVYFTHNESCKASVTINGVTLNNLNRHYAEGGLCSPTYSLWNTIRQNVDNEQSKIFCHNVVLSGLGGQPITFTDCNTIAFYLNKSTFYNYSVNWENGQTTYGSFTSPSGGGQLPICISNNGPECNHSLDGKWLASDGTGILMSGLSGSFYSFSNNWQLFVNNNTLSVGSLKIRNVSQVNSAKWNCQVLFLHIINGQPDAVAWSVDGTIVMSASGNSVTISATSPFSGNYSSGTYTRDI